MAKFKEFVRKTGKAVGFGLSETEKEERHKLQQKRLERKFEREESEYKIQNVRRKRAETRAKVARAKAQERKYRTPLIPPASQSRRGTGGGFDPFSQSPAQFPNILMGEQLPAIRPVKTKRKKRRKKK